jgi:hypothetical protein
MMSTTVYRILVLSTLDGNILPDLYECSGHESTCERATSTATNNEVDDEEHNAHEVPLPVLDNDSSDGEET